MKHASLHLSFLIVLFVASSAVAQTPTPDGQSEGEYVEGMAREHADDSPTSNPMSAEGAGDVAVSADMVRYGGSDDTPLMGYHAAPEGRAPVAGVVLIHEWWGLNDNIRAMADRFAAEGYRVLALDMYGGEVAETPEGARGLMQAAMADVDAGVANLTQAVAWIQSQGVTSVGTVGWCFGGGWSLRAGLTQGDAVDAVVVYYGHVQTDREALAPLAAPLIGFFGAEDGGIPVDDVRAFEEALEANGADAEIHVYDGAGHAFANPSGHNYQEAPAQDSWRRTLAFLAEHLGQAGDAAPATEP